MQAGSIGDANFAVYIPAGEVAGAESEAWAVLHEGMPVRSKQANQLPAVVRAISRSSCRGPDVPAFWAALGFQRQYSMVKAGHAFCCFLDGHEVDVSVLQIFKEAPGGLRRGQAVSEGLWLVDARACAEEGRYMEAAAAIGKLSGFLEPLVTLQKP